ncbi:MAG: leucine-rich repeat domain-containing protein [Ruminococcus sp.]|nr:leucine-rich repeat domain-containing protein [Ruminococcus sp.]
MENFQINAEGNLTAYHNDDKRIDKIIVPDGVKYISYAVFREYNINHIVLPNNVEYIGYGAFNGAYICTTATKYITYRGATFNCSGYYNDVHSVIYMIRDKDYSCVLSHNLKYPVILQIYFNDGDDVTTAYIKKNFKKFFIFLTDEIIKNNKNNLSMKYSDIKNAPEIMSNLIKSGKFITKRNIETYVKIADEKECHEVFDMLEEYREENLK